MSQTAQHPQVTEYLNSVCARIRCQEVHPEIRQELAGHIADLAEAGREAGLPETAAIERALEQMGDPALVGLQLHQAHRPRTEWGLLGATLLLVLVGLWAMYAVDASGFYPLGVGFFGKKLVWSAIGMVAGGVLMFVDYRRLRRFCWPLFGATLAGILWAGAGRLGWVNGQAQYVTLAPLLLTPALAGILSEWDWKAPWSLLKALGLLVIPVLMLAAVHSITSLTQYVVILVVMLAGTRPTWRQALALAGAGATLGGLGLWLVYQRSHLQGWLLAWLSPLRDPLGAGFQVKQSMESLRTAGLWGHGATAQVPTLPEVQTDFVFPYLVHTLGWVAGAGVCLVAVFFLFRLAQVARHVRDPFGAMVVRGALTLFALEFGWNIAMTAGLAPMAGVELPFISYGRREVLQLAALGLVLGVFRRKDLGGAQIPS